MSDYYNPQRTRNLYDPEGSAPFKLSRSKIDLFRECPRCFYLDRRLGVGRPPGFPFTLNSAVDALLKKEFDKHRALGTKHPLMEKYKVEAIPAKHADLNTWRENFKGIQFHHKPTNFIITGAIDDLWINPKGDYIVVDYKATAKDEDMTSLDKDWHAGYKRQMEVYQWLFRKNGFPVSNTGYFVYANGKADREGFEGRLEFDLTLIAYEGSSDWVDREILNISQCLKAPKPPKASGECDYCNYTQAVGKIGGLSSPSK